MDLGNHLQHQILRQRAHSRPVLDVGTELDLLGRIGHALAVKDAVLIDPLVKEISGIRENSIHIGGCGEISLVGRGSRNGTGIHQRHGSDLSILQLRALPVGEVPGGMTDGEAIVAWGISCAEARTAESSLHDCSGLHQRRYRTILHQFHVDRRAGRIDA